MLWNPQWQNCLSPVLILRYVLVVYMNHIQHEYNSFWEAIQLNYIMHQTSR